MKIRRHKPRTDSNESHPIWMNVTWSYKIVKRLIDPGWSECTFNLSRAYSKGVKQPIKNDL